MNKNLQNIIGLLLEDGGGVAYSRITSLLNIPIEEIENDLENVLIKIKNILDFGCSPSLGGVGGPPPSCVGWRHASTSAADDIR